MMASDNEDDDLEALRKAALATLKQKVQPIEKVISGGILSRPENSPPWSEVPASIDFLGFADPVPEAASFPVPHVTTVTPQPPPPWPPVHHNGMARPGQRFRYERNKFDPRFPHRTFGDRGGPMYDRGMRRMRRAYVPQQGSGSVLSRIPFDNQSHPRNPLIPLSQGPAPGNVGTNLIVIQPQTSSGEREALPPSTHSIVQDRSNAGSNPPVINKSISQKKSNLALPQDKYHVSPGAEVSTKREDDEAKPETKAKDKFSRYDQSDSDEDDASDVDDIANEIDKVLQDDILDSEVTPESEEVKDKEEESVPDLSVSDTKSDGEDIDALAEESDSDQSDKESLDLDALAGGDPVIGDFEDLDSLVDRDPDNDPVIDSDKDDNSVHSDRSDRAKNVSVNSPRSISHGDEVSHGKKETNNKGDNCLEIAVSDKTLHTDLEAALTDRSSSVQKQSKSPPPNHRSPQRRCSISPSRYDSYKAHPLSPRRSRSPLYTNRRRSSSPKRSPPRYSNRSNIVSRRSISPRRRASPVGSSFSQRRFASPRNYFRSREHSPRRRSMSPIRRNRSPQRDRIRDGRQDSRYARDYNSSRRGEDQFGHRLHGDRPPPQQHERHERQLGSSNPTPQEKTKPRESNLKTESSRDEMSTSKKKISPLLERNTSSERDKITVDLEKLTPEERARIEARRKKFDSKEELKVTETGKTISLKSIKAREKKQKKKNEKESASKEDEALPKVSKKKTEGISLKKLRKKQESKKSTEHELDNDSPKAVRLLDLEDDSEESDGERSWKKESADLVSKIKFTPSQSPPKAAFLSLDRIRAVKNRFDSKKHNDRHKQTSHKERAKPHRLQNKWSSDEEDNGDIGVNRLSSSVRRSKPFEADLPPDKLRVQVQVTTTKESKKKSKALPDFSKVYSVPAKRHNEMTENSHVVKDEEEVPTKKLKKKKEKKKKHSKAAGKSSHVVLDDDDDANNTLQPPSSPAKPSVLERLGKKVDLKSIEKREKKRSKKSHSSDEGTNDLDNHIRKMKAKNEEILRRQREIQLDKEKYG